MIVVRPQVQSVLAGRFERQVTSVVAGAGFGKTTAIVRALDENRIAPQGVDVWLGCEPADADARHLADGLERAWSLVLDACPASTPTGFAEACAGAAPLEICLVMDDAHHVAATPGARAWLLELIAELPANGHIVLVGRTAIGAPGHAAAMIDERSLAFTDEQVGEYHRRVGNTVSAGSADAGWPALVELSARNRSSRGFLDEHVLGDADSDASRLIDCLVAAGRADRALISAVVGDVDLDEIEHLPLVDRLGDEFVAHSIWHDARSAGEPVARCRRRVIAELRRRGELARVVDVCIAAQDAHEQSGAPAPDPEEWKRALLAALGAHEAVAPDELRRWCQGASNELAVSGPGLLLAGLVARLDRPADQETVHVLRRAAASFARSGDERSEALALSALTYPLHARGDALALRATYGRLIELSAKGVGEADEQSHIARAVIATATGDLATARDVTRDILETARPGRTRTAALWMLCNALNGLGESAIQPAEELSVSGHQLPGMCAAEFTARWKLGMVRELTEMADVNVSGHRDRYVMAVWNAFLSGALGDLGGADVYLRFLREANDDGRAIAPDGSNVFPEAALDLERDHVECARRRMRAFVAAHPPDGPARGVYVMAVGLLHLHLPELRPTFDAMAAGPLFQLERDVARGLARLIEESDTESIRTTTLPERVGKLLSTFGLRHTVEYLSAAYALEVDRAASLVEELVDLVGAPARSRLTTAAAHADTTISAGASEILSAVPVQPEGRLDINLLGDASIFGDGRRIDDANWRRERVRALLTFVILHPNPTREIAVAELWPDMAIDAGRKNLRTTINRLHHVLEPDRDSGHAPFHLRSRGQLLALHTGDRIGIDIHRFERHLDAARRSEADGTPSLAVPDYLAAVGCYRGDLLPDSYDTWVLVRRDTLRSQFVQAGVRCAELLSASDRNREAIELLVRVLGFEPYSEPAHRAMVVAQLGLGDAAAARRAMETCETVLAEVGGIVETATAMVWRRVGRRRPAGAR